MNITTECPQCGGDITFDEELQVLTCPYCASVMQICGKYEQPHFMLKPSWPRAECDRKLRELVAGGSSGERRLKINRLELVLAPYWRCKGMVFHWILGKRESWQGDEPKRSWDDAKELKTKAFDFTFPAYEEPDLGLQSLGVRTAAVKLYIFHPSRLRPGEHWLPPQVGLRRAVEMSDSFLTFGFAERDLKAEVENTQLLGETYSIVFFPFWVVEVAAGHTTGLIVVDGLANRVCTKVWDTDFPRHFHAPTHKETQVAAANLKLVPHRCPVCGWDLPVISYSKTHVCTNCYRAWSEAGGDFQETNYRLAALPPDWRQAYHYLPFWQIRLRIETAGPILDSRGDLGSLSPALALGLTPAQSAAPIAFLIPAFKVRSLPSLAKLATQFCQRPPEVDFRAPDTEGTRRCQGVFLAGREAEEMAPVVLYSLVPRYNRKARQLLKESRVVASRPELVYFPFYRQGIYLREIHSGHAVQAGTVDIKG